MAQVFRDCSRRAYQDGGGLALMALWARTTLDYLKTMVEEYARGGTYMTREKFIKLSGWALLVGSISILIGWLAESRPEYSQFNAASLPIDRYANLAAVPLVIMGVLLVSLGMLGLQARYGGKAGGFGRLTLVIGALSGLVSAVGMVGLAIYDSDPWWSLFFMGWVIQYLMLALFGIVCLRRQLLPRWNGLPLLAGIWLPVFMLVSLVYENATGSWVELPDAVFIFLFSIGAFGFAGLGYLLQSDAQPVSPIKA
ncbi:MAG: hypothetical protein ACWGO1_15835 [Anaerolineales bacterium]